MSLCVITEMLSFFLLILLFKMGQGNCNYRVHVMVNRGGVVVVVTLGLLREVRENIFKGKLRQSTLVILKQQPLSETSVAILVVAQCFEKSNHNHLGECRCRGGLCLRLWFSGASCHSWGHRVDCAGSPSLCDLKVLFCLALT